MNILKHFTIFSPSLTTEIQGDIGELERSLIQHELQAFDLAGKINAIKRKLEYLKSHPQSVHPESRS